MSVRTPLTIALAWAIVYLPALGSRGLAASEGHRVLPAIEMLRSGDFVVPRLFGQIYLRKPPGMFWAIAASMSVLGETELAARFVSAFATLLAGLACAWFAHRWYAPLAARAPLSRASPALAAGLSFVLMPMLWAPGRSAEIESLHNLCVLVASLAILDASLMRNARPRTTISIALLAFLATAGAVLVKGPAGVPVLGAAVVGACAAQRSLVPLRRVSVVPPMLAGLALGAGVILWCWSRARETGEPIVLQGVSEFLWSLPRLGQTLLLPLAAWAMALPMSIALLFPLAPFASRDDLARDESAPARAVAWTILLALAIYVILGVHNPRYAMPAMCLVPMLVPYALLGRTLFMPLRARLATLCTLGSPGAFVGLVLVGAGAHIAIEVHRFRDDRDPAYTGRPAGLALGESLEQHARATNNMSDDSPLLIYADHAVEARPEVLWYASSVLERAHTPARVRWLPGLADANDLPAGAVLVLRADSASPELRARAARDPDAASHELWRGRVHEFELVALTTPSAVPSAE
jgi:4-amino-4-deoxy-L-arabinose transferase-like glycosyltransferase